ncbi:MAG: carbon starvation CstA family protein [Pirellulaceae bacterium]
MNLLYIVLPSAIVLTIAYFTYGRLLARLFRLDPKQITPAHELKDGLDYEPLAPGSLVPQHFSAIAAAGPIVGPIIAGLTFGWLPALIWILVGSILIGGVHDMGALVASIRHKARSIAEVVRDNMSRRSYLLFLTFIWLALVYIIVAFTDVTAGSFLGEPTPENGNVGGGAIASASLLYLGLTILMGVCLRYFKTPKGITLVAFIVLVGGAIVAGPWMPLDVAELAYRPAEGASADLYAAAKANDAGAIATISQTRKGWDIVLLLYCLFAGMAPVWMILQPRGQLGGYFLYFALGAGALGLMMGGSHALYPAFRGWEAALPKAGATVQPLFPILFIMIACGACSGFHSLIASGTTSKQLRSETDAKVVGYGTMLMEAMVAIVALSCVMMFAEGASELSGAPNQIYAHGISQFLGAFSVPRGIGMAFALMAFATFVYDTLDVCTRLGRFILQELTGLHNWVGRFLGTALTAGVPVYFLLATPNVVLVDGKYAPPPPVWLTFWNLFGASNQLLAALTLLGITVWLWRTRRAWWVWLVTGVPTVWMYVMSTWALASMTLPAFRDASGWRAPADPVPWVGLLLIALAGLMLIEAIRILASLGTPTPPTTKAIPAGAAGS